MGFTFIHLRRDVRCIGPSPRAWGLLNPHVLGEPECRSIPTCVGFTHTPGSAPCRQPVHPHVRGVYVVRPHAPGPPFGPSPRAWGLRLLATSYMSAVAVHPHVRGVYAYHQITMCIDERSIPTCVGFTRLPARTVTPQTVHPHVRGVYFSYRFFLSSFYGPSPRAWGLPLQNPAGG